MSEKVSKFNNAAPLDGTEYVPVIQYGANRKTTVQKIVDLAATTGGATIDDTTPSLTKVYSSQKTEDLLSNKVDVVAGKQLSTEDYTTAEKTKLSGIAAGAQVNDPNTTLQGNTFNGISQLVKLDGAGKLPAVDGSQLTNLPAASISGTANRISVVAGVIDIAAAYIGQNTITTLGTIGTGVWQGTAIASGYGGTGFTAYAKGDLIYASAVNTLAKLAASADGNVLTLAGGVPTWAAAAGGLPSQAGNAGKLLTTDGTTASWGTAIPGIWSVNGTSLYYNAGNVGINNSAPAYPLEITNSALGTGIANGLVLSSYATLGSSYSNPPAISFKSQYYQSGTLPSEFRISARNRALNFDMNNNNAAFTSCLSITNDGFGGVLAARSLSLTLGIAFANGSIGTSGNGAITNNTNMVLQVAPSTFTSTAYTNTGTISSTTGSGASNYVYTSFLSSPTFNNSLGLGTVTARGFYYNPTNTNLTGIRSIGFHAETGDNLFGTTSGSVGIGATTTIDASAILQVTSTSKGVLFPSMSTTQVAAIATPAEGLQAYDNTLHGLKIYNGTVWNNIVHSAIANGKVTTGAPFTNDGYIIVTIGGTNYKLMTTT